MEKLESGHSAVRSLDSLKGAEGGEYAQNLAHSLVAPGVIVCPSGESQVSHVVYLRERESRVLGLFSRTVKESYLVSLNNGADRSVFKGHVAIYDRDPGSGYRKVMVVDPRKNGGCKVGFIREEGFKKCSSPQEKDQENQSGNEAHIANFMTQAAFPNITAGVLTLAGVSGDNGINGFKLMGATLIIFGALAANESIKGYINARKIDDVAGAFFSMVRLARSGLQVGFGTTLLGARVVSLVGPSMGVEAYARSSTAFSVAATALGVPLFTLLMVQSSAQLVGATKIIKGLNRASEVGTLASLQFLVNQISLLGSDFEDVASRFDTPEKLYSYISEGDSLTQEESDILSPDDFELIAQRILALDPKDYPLVKENFGSVRWTLFIKASKELAKKKLVKRTEFIRAVGINAYEAVVKEGRALLEGNLTIDALNRVSEIVRIDRRGAIKKVILSVMYIFAAAMGITALIIGSLFTAGLPFLISSIIGLSGNTFMVSADGVLLIDLIKRVNSMRLKDKVLVITLFALTIISIIAGSLFTGGILPLGVILAVGGAMIAMQLSILIYMWYQSRKAEEAARLNLA